MLDWLLDRKDAFWIDKGFRRIVEVDVFDIEVRNQVRAVPERPANFKAAVQKQIQRLRRIRLKRRGGAVITAREKFAREFAAGGSPDEFKDASSNIRVAIILHSLFDHVHRRPAHSGVICRREMPAC